MKVTNISKAQLQSAINAVNKKHGYDIIFNRSPEQKGKYIHFTIRSSKSGIPGSRVSLNGRKLISASWHAHGYLFEEILKISPDANIITGSNNINKDGGNWKDWRISWYIHLSETSIL